MTDYQDIEGAPKDGDVFFWRWKDKERDADCAPFRSYHCMSMKALAKGGNLYDTYWSDYSHRLNHDAIVVYFQGNIHEMRQIRPHEVNYYRSEQVLDMRHPNSSRAEIYVEQDAGRDPETMIAHLNYKIEDAEGTISVKEHAIEWLYREIAEVESGKLDGVMS